MATGEEIVTPDLSDEQLSIHRLWSEADSINEVIEHHQTSLDGFYDDRAGVWARLVEYGVTINAIAAHHGMNARGISAAIKARAKRVDS